MSSIAVPAGTDTDEPMLANPIHAHLRQASRDRMAVAPTRAEAAPAGATPEALLRRIEQSRPVARDAQRHLKTTAMDRGRVTLEDATDRLDWGAGMPVFVLCRDHRLVLAPLAAFGPGAAR